MSPAGELIRAMTAKKRVLNPRFLIYNCLDGSFADHLSEDITRGLTSQRKYIPSKYFYDTRGSRLFEEICSLPEYYLTRTEISILEAIAPDIIGSFLQLDLVEMGSGSEEKISRLIRASSHPGGEGIRYIPVDVSESALLEAGRCLTSRFPHIQVLGLVADFCKHLKHLPNVENTLFVLLGSTIGNLSPVEMNILLQEVARVMDPNDRFLLGLDMVKDTDILKSAYNDSRGVTAEFNKNILHVMNREASADFDVDGFDHLAIYNHELEQVEMHLIANRSMTVTLGEVPLTVKIEKGETIRTEISRKFTRERVEEVIGSAGLAARSWYSDPEGWFSLVELTRIPG